MSNSSYLLFRSILNMSACKCRSHNLAIFKSVQCLGHIQKYYSTEQLPLPNDGNKRYSPRIHHIVNDISQLTLIEVADLNELLKKTLKIQDARVTSMVVPAPAELTKEEEEQAVAAPAKMTFSVKLTGFDTDKKAKKFVESTPVNVKTDLTKDEAEELKKALESVGAKIMID